MYLPLRRTHICKKIVDTLRDLRQLLFPISPFCSETTVNGIACCRAISTKTVLLFENPKKTIAYSATLLNLLSLIYYESNA